MIDKKREFYVKRMQKSVTVGCGTVLILGLCFLCGCVRKDQAGVCLKEWELEEVNPEQIPDAGDISAELSEEADGEVQKEAVKEEQGGLTEETANEPPTLYVHICGAVENPGVYELPAGSRVFEAVRLAGGFSGEADENYVNQAQEVPDAGKVVIPTVEETGLLKETGEEGTGFGILMPEMWERETFRQEDSDKAAGNSSGLVNINTADKAELCSLPGIGNAKAEAVLSYREKKGRFSSVEELKKVDGIGDSVYTGLKDRICVE